MEEKNIIIEKYILDPCRFHASALWKTLFQENLKTEIQTNKNEITIIKLYTDKVLYLYWNKYNNDICDISGYQLALLHHSQITVPLKGCDNYFRLKHENRNHVYCTPEHQIKDVHVSRETKLIKDFINKCYREINITEEDIMLWTQHPVYDKALWIWIADKITGEYIGLGIAEYDRGVNEGSLEWIQVLPEYRGKGVGKAIVNELLRRLQKADFITVSGRADDKAAERLYRTCGFEGDDIWCVVRK